MPLYGSGGMGCYFSYCHAVSQPKRLRAHINHEQHEQHKGRAALHKPETCLPALPQDSLVVDLVRFQAFMRTGFESCFNHGVSKVSDPQPAKPTPANESLMQSQAWLAAWNCAFSSAKHPCGEAMMFHGVPCQRTTWMR
eukprot:546147-Amphidinium_carterae.1